MEDNENGSCEDRVYVGSFILSSPNPFSMSVRIMMMLVSIVGQQPRV